MTRVLKFSAVAILAVMVLWACGGAALGAKETAEKFLKAVKTQDFKTAKSLATKDTQGAVEMFEGQQAGKPAGNAADIVVGDVKEEGDKATASYTDAGEAKTLELMKEGGAWKAVFVKPGGSNPLEDATKGLGEMMNSALDSMGDAIENAVDGATHSDEESHEGHDH